MSAIIRDDESTKRAMWPVKIEKKLEYVNLEKYGLDARIALGNN